MSERKILPLMLMKANGEEPIEGRTRFQKMIFLTQKQAKVPNFRGEQYEYFPYNYGPFSKELYGDIDELVEDGVIEERVETKEDDKKKYYYELTSKGRELLEDELKGQEYGGLKEKIEEIKSRYNKMDLPDILDEIYAKYPDFAENSVL